MKKLTLLFAASLAFQTGVWAQSTSCAGTTAPALENTTSSVTVGGGGGNPAPVFVNQGQGFTRTEFAIAKRGTPARDQAGNPDTTGQSLSPINNVIIGADDSDGIFLADYLTRYGITLSPGDTIELTAIGYNLGQVRGLVQKILTGSVQATGATCCQVLDLTPDARGFCDTLRNIGITDSNSVNNLADVLNVFDAFSPRQLSVRGLIANMAQVNSFGAEPLFPVECGKNDLPICYGIDINARYAYVTNQAIAVERIGALSSFALLPNPATQGRFTLMLSAEQPVSLAVRIYNGLGQMVYQQNMGEVQGMRAENISTRDFSPGMYFVEITDGISRETRKLLVH